MSSGAPNGICKISQIGGKQPIRAALEPAVSEQLSKGFFKAWKQSHEEVQKSSFLSEHLNYNMLKGYYDVFTQWCQKYTAYCSFKYEK